MQERRVCSTVILLLTFFGLALAPGCQRPDARRTSAEAEVLTSFGDFLQAHTAGSAQLLLEDAAVPTVNVFAGELSRPSREEQMSNLETLFERLHFTEYRSLVEPEVHVSGDGQMAWLVAKTAARGVPSSDEGRQGWIAYSTAWLIVYEKRDGRWRRVATASSITDVPP